MANANFVNKFNESLRVGKIGEKMMLGFMQQQFPKVKVEDLSEVKQFQWKEVDFRFTFPDGRVKLVELKTDTWSNMPNLAIETWANVERGRKGWLHTSEADVLAYLFVNGLDSGEPNLWFISMEHVRDVVAQNPHLKTYEPPKESQVNGDGMKTTRGVRVPRRLITPLSTYHVEPILTSNSHSVRQAS